MLTNEPAHLPTRYPSLAERLIDRLPHDGGVTGRTHVHQRTAERGHRNAVAYLAITRTQRRPVNDDT